MIGKIDQTYFREKHIFHSISQTIWFPVLFTTSPVDPLSSIYLSNFRFKHKSITKGTMRNCTTPAYTPTIN